MRTVYKYAITPNSVAGGTHIIKIEAPLGAVPLCVMMQNSRAYIWMEVVTDRAHVEYRFACIGTGHGLVPEDGAYLGSVVDGFFVWHLYRLPC